MDVTLIKYLMKNRYDHVVIDKWVGEKIYNQFVGLAQFYDISTINIKNIVEFYEKTTLCCPILHLEIEDEDPHALLERPTKQFLMLKRLMDICIVAFSMPIVLPVTGLAVLLTWISSKGPAIFTQERIGLNGKMFTIFKIRTMVHNPNGHLDHTIRGDKRITKLGKLLRKTKIDEFPQFYNVLRGEMSFIGPRPERKDIVDKFKNENIFYPLRHIVKPGITGWAQVNNPCATPEETLEKLEYDLYYINHLSLKLELNILLKTVGVVSSLESL